MARDNEKKLPLHVRALKAVFALPPSPAEPVPARREQSTDRVVQGTQLTPMEVMARRANALLTTLGREYAWPLTGFMLPHKYLYNHVMFLGTTGSGKSTLLNQIKRTTLKTVGAGLGHRACIWDFKSEELQHLATLGLWGKVWNPKTGQHEEGPLKANCPVYYINPTDTRGVGVDFAKDVTNEIEARQFARDMIAEKSKEDSEGAVWVKSARNAVALVVGAFQQTCGTAWTLHDVVHACSSFKRLERVLSLTNRGRETLEESFGTEGQRKGIMMTIQGFSDDLKPVAAAMSKRRCISLKEWATRSEGIIVIGNNPTLKESLAPLQRWMFGHMTRTILLQKSSETHRYLFFLDEVRQAPFGNYLGELATNGRSKGACIIAGLQDRSGLKDTLGDHNAEEFLGMFDHLVVLNLRSPDTAKWASDYFGKHLKEITEVSDGTGRNTSRSLSDTYGGSSGIGNFTRSWSGGVTDTLGYNENTTRSIKTVERTIVYGSEFRALAKPSWQGEDGLVLECYVAIPGVGDGKIVVGHLESKTIKPDPTIESSINVDDDAFRSEWTPADLERLNLPKKFYPALLGASQKASDGDGPQQQVPGSIEVEVSRAHAANQPKDRPQYREEGPLIYSRCDILE